MITRRSLGLAVAGLLGIAAQGEARRKGRRKKDKDTSPVVFMPMIEERFRGVDIKDNSFFSGSVYCGKGEAVTGGSYDLYGGYADNWHILAMRIVFRIKGNVISNEGWYVRGWYGSSLGAPNPPKLWVGAMCQKKTLPVTRHAP
ncbi:MAG: hypothetical protein ACKOWF_08350 [Chloroflexota bacterium]